MPREERQCATKAMIARTSTGLGGWDLYYSACSEGELDDILARDHVANLETSVLWRSDGDEADGHQGIFQIRRPTDLEIFQYMTLIYLGWSWDEVTHAWKAPGEYVSPPICAPVQTTEFEVGFDPDLRDIFYVGFGAEPAFLNVFLLNLVNSSQALIEFLEIAAQGAYARVALCDSPAFPIYELQHYAIGDDQVRIVGSVYDDFRREVRFDILTPRNVFFEGILRGLKGLPEKAKQVCQEDYDDFVDALEGCDTFESEPVDRLLLEWPAQRGAPADRHSGD